MNFLSILVFEGRGKGKIRCDVVLVLWFIQFVFCFFAALDFARTAILILICDCPFHTCSQ